MTFLRPLLFLVGMTFFLSVGLSAKPFRTVVIDAGHGGHDKGGQWGLVYEKHLALDTAVRLERELKKRGYRTAMTRRSDHFVTLADRVKFCKRYRDPIFISVHYNYTWKQHVSGIETFYYSSKSRQLAADVHRGVMQQVSTTDRGVKYARYYVIRRNTCPAILVEGGFVSNARERKRMKSARWRQSIADGIADGVSRYRRR